MFTGNKSRIYCSEDCQKTAKNKADRERYRKRAETLGKKQCVGCGTVYLPRHADQKYCCKKCAAKYVDTRPTKEKEKDWVRIRVTKSPEGVYPQMLPVVGRQYRAIRFVSGNMGRFGYLIPGIGRFGLLLRDDEAEVVCEDGQEEIER